ncbi:hypothetical protein VTL71DRAFT_4789 [Oculimacula yallundae]|uniref:Uncharacterized protein n=1 Tax=Oculimacula yallundae TaxID=86028 RepID=A0ABR4C309_9HELO
MRSSIIFLTSLTSVLAAPAPQASGSLGLGEQCASSAECANGANCYSTNSGLITRCGNFQASCSSNEQCAYNTCENGLCNGFIPSTTASPSSYPTGPPVTVYIPLGADCNPNSTPCANGSTCYATNSMLQPRCGNFQANCSNDSQCAFNTCQNGFCNGFIASTTTSASSYPVASSTSSSQASSTSTAVPLALGTNCDPKTDVCAGGAQCFASNYMQQPQCGKYNAACTTDAQCDTNSCNNGLCNGFLTTSSYPVASTASSVPASSAPSATYSAIESSAPVDTYTSSDAQSSAPATTPMSTEVPPPVATTAVSSETAAPAQSTVVVVTTPIVTESSVVIAVPSTTANPASTPASSAPAQIITNAASASKNGNLGLAIAGVLAIVAIV